LTSALLLLLAGSVGCSSPVRQPTQPSAFRAQSEEKLVQVIKGFAAGLAGVRAGNPAVKVSVGRDPAVEESVLLVDYPRPTGDAAGRDVWCDAELRDWSEARALAFRVKPAHAVKLSVSFFDRNGVAYTTWVELRGRAE